MAELVTALVLCAVVAIVLLFVCLRWISRRAKGQPVSELPPVPVETYGLGFDPFAALWKVLPKEPDGCKWELSTKKDFVDGKSDLVLLASLHDLLLDKNVGGAKLTLFPDERWTQYDFTQPYVNWANDLIMTYRKTKLMEGVQRSEMKL